MSRIPKRLLNRRSPPRVVSIVEGIGDKTPTMVQTSLQTSVNDDTPNFSNSLSPIHISLTETQRLPEEESTDLPLSLVTSVDNIPNQKSMTRTLVPRRPSKSINSGKSKVRSASSKNSIPITRGLDVGKGAKNLAQRRIAALSFQQDGTILTSGDLQIWRLSRKVREDEKDKLRIQLQGNQGVRLTFHQGGGGIIQDLEVPPDSQPAEIVVPIGTTRFTLTGLGGMNQIPVGITPGAAALTSIMSTRNRTFIGFQRNSLVHQIGSYRFLCRGVFIEADGTPSWASFQKRNTHTALDVLSKIDHLKVFTSTHVRSLCIITRTRESSQESFNLDLTGIRTSGEGTRIERLDGVAHVWPVSADASYSGPALIEILTDEHTDVHDVILSTSADQSVIEMLSSSEWRDLIEEGAFSPHGHTKIRWIDNSESAKLRPKIRVNQFTLSKESETKHKELIEQGQKGEEEERSLSAERELTVESKKQIEPTNQQVEIDLPGIIAFEQYDFDISKFAGDFDEEDQGKLVFTRISGPEWLSVSSSGKMNGNPTNDDVGINQFLIRVTDPGGLFSDALVNIEVSFKELNRAPFWSPTVIPSKVKENNSDDISKLNKSKQNSESKPRRRRRR